ncbi:MAG TPA: DUF6152 family protein [Steroidobacteraceae bacterium]|nr:DUF6152 family protein [Steroidobacteraceae bacterium]
MITRNRLRAVALLLFPALALAHHAATMFDGTRTVTLSGTVKTFEWTNPHVWLWVNVIDDKGVVTPWGIETANLSMARRLGMDRNSFKPGDRITLTFNPLKDGREGGRFRKAVFADGHVIDFSPPGVVAPDPNAQ